MMATILPINCSEAGLTHYLQQVYSAPLLSETEEKDLMSKWCSEGNIEAAHKLVVSHLRLVVKIAFSFQRYGAVLLDVISEGNIGLMKAVKKFDPNAGCRLATYAIWWIKAAIQEYILRSWSLLKINTTSLKKKLFSSLSKTKAQINSLEYNKEKIEHSTSRYLLSLDAKVDEDSEVQFSDTISDTYDTHDNTIADHEEGLRRKLMLRCAISKLNDRERDIFCSRKLANDSVILDDLAAKYAISRERVRQIEEASMKKVISAIHAQDSMSLYELRVIADSLQPQTT